MQLRAQCRETQGDGDTGQYLLTKLSCRLCFVSSPGLGPDYISARRSQLQDLAISVSPWSQHTDTHPGHAEFTPLLNLIYSIRLVEFSEVSSDPSDDCVLPKNAME